MVTFETQLKIQIISFGKMELRPALTSRNHEFSPLKYLYNKNETVLESYGYNSIMFE